MFKVSRVVFPIKMGIPKIKYGVPGIAVRNIQKMLGFVPQPNIPGCLVAEGSLFPHRLLWCLSPFFT